MDAKRGDWVRVHNIVLKVGGRANNIPEDTKNVALEMLVKGILLDEGANIGDMVKIETYIGRRIEGKLLEINPFYDHDFGKFNPELIYIGRQARDLLEEAVNKID